MRLQVLDFAIPVSTELIQVVPKTSFSLAQFLCPQLELIPLHLHLLLGYGLSLGVLAVVLVESPDFAREFSLQALVRL